MFFTNLCLTLCLFAASPRSKFLNKVFVVFRRKVENVFQAAIAEEEDEEEQNEEPVQRKKVINRHFNQAYAEEITSKTLASYGDICSVLRNPQRGLNALHFSKNKHKSIKTKPLIIRNVNVYNSILKGFAQKGDYFKIREVLNLMNEGNVSLNVQSHIYVLECLGRMDINKLEKEMKSYMNEIFGNNINFDQLMNNGAFYEGQRDLVLKAIKAYNPSYEPQYVKPDIQYSNHLVNHLNNNEPKLDSRCQERIGVFSAESLAKATKKQLELEKGGYVMASTIFI